MKRFAIGLLILSSLGCASMLEIQFRQEFDWNADTVETTIYRIPVRTPCWLHEDDVPGLLEYIDKSWRDFAAKYPWVYDRFDPSRYTIYIHDAPGAFVAGSASHHVWALGWAVGRFLVVSWAPARNQHGEPDGPAEKDCLPALTHEWMHVVLSERFGCGDAGHIIWFPGDECQRAMICPRIMSLKIELGAATVAAFKRFRYRPWIYPGLPA